MRQAAEAKLNILEVQDLQLAFFGANGRVEALHGVSLSVAPGEIVALVGESGSGKTALCRAVLGLHANHAVIERGQILLAGRDVSALTESEWCALRGRVASMVFQDPMSAFDPVYPIGAQIAEVLLLHPERLAAADPGAGESEAGGKHLLQAGTSILRRRSQRQEQRRRAETAAVALLDKLGFDEPQKRARQYPHEFSGGMLQRAAIALAMIAEPQLLIADEPTTALDIETQQEIMRLLRETCVQQSCSMLFVTHDLGLAEQIADRIMVMKDGLIVEEGQTARIFACPQHAYTKKLLGYAAYGKGTSHYHGRIGAAEQGATSTEPEVNGAAEPAMKMSRAAAQQDTVAEPETRMRCAAAQQAAAAEWSPSRQPALQPAAGASDTLLSVRGLSKSFPIDKHSRKSVLDKIDLEIHRGEIVGLIGPSGIGKSTLARCIMGICAPDSGEVIVREGVRIQMIFQDSAAAFNPHMTIAEIIAEPLVLAARRQRLGSLQDSFTKAAARRRMANRHTAAASHADGTDVQRCTGTAGKLSKAVLRERVLTVMRQVELEPELAMRHPYDLSGGQRQRAAIARALITEPDLIICDEPISSLDVSLQADIIHLLKKLQEEHGLSLLVISHDLPMVEHISDRIVKL